MSISSRHSVTDCPCSDHIFKLTSSKPHVKHISEVYALLISSTQHPDIYAITAEQLQRVRDKRATDPGWIKLRDSKLMYYSTRNGELDFIVISSDSPIYVMLGPCQHIDKLRDTYYLPCVMHQCKHILPHVNTHALVSTYRHNPAVWEYYAESMMARFHSGNWPDELAAAMRSACMRELQLQPVYTEFYTYHHEDIDCVHACSREVQDTLMRAYVDQGCIFASVPKDVLKIIHRMVFEGHVIA